MGAGNRISMLCLGEAIGHGLYDWILQRTETAQTQRWIAAECGREGLLENSKDGGLKHLTTTGAEGKYTLGKTLNKAWQYATASGGGTLVNSRPCTRRYKTMGYD